MKCTKAKSLLSWHLDGNLEIEDRRALAEHLGSCTDCHAELLSLKQMRSLVHSVGRQPAPADLALKIRLALSREAAKVHQENQMAEENEQVAHRAGAQKWQR